MELSQAKDKDPNNCFKFCKDLNQNFGNDQKKLVPLTNRHETTYKSSNDQNI